MNKHVSDQQITLVSLLFILAVSLFIPLINISLGVSFMLLIPVLFAWKAGRRKVLITVSVASLMGFTVTQVLGSIWYAEANTISQLASLITFTLILVAIIYQPSAEKALMQETANQTTQQEDSQELDDWEIGAFLDDDLKEEVRAISESQSIPNMEFAKPKEGAMKRLLTLETKFHALDQVALIAISDISGNITYVNDNFANRSKYSKKELIGHNHRVQKSGKHPSGYFDELRLTVAANKVWHGEICNRAKDGSYYWMDTIVAPVEAEVTPDTKYIAFGIDITHFKEKQEHEDPGFLRAFSRQLAEKNVRLQEEIDQLAESNHLLEKIRSPFSSIEKRWDLFVTKFEAFGIKPISSGQKHLSNSLYWVDACENNLHFVIGMDQRGKSQRDQAILSDFLHSTVNLKGHVVGNDTLTDLKTLEPSTTFLIGHYQYGSDHITLLSSSSMTIKVNDERKITMAQAMSFKHSVEKGQESHCYWQVEDSDSEAVGLAF